MAVDRVRRLIELGRWSQARALLAPLLAASPDDPDLHELDAAALDGLDDPAGVLTAAARAAALAPARPEPHRLMAYAHHALGDHDAAYRSAVETRRLAPHDWAAHATVAMMAADAAPHREEATPAAEEALRLAPDLASSHFAAGYAAQALGRRRLARRHYRRALALDPQHPQALNNLTMVGGRRRPGGELRGYAEALRADPQAAVPLGNLQAVAIRLLKRLFVVGLVAAIAGVLLTGLGTAPVDAGSRLAGAVAAVVAAALVLAFVAGCTRPVRHALRHELGRRWELWVVLGGTAAMLALGLALCWVDGVAATVGRHGLLLWLLLVLPLRVRLRAWWRRRRADDEAATRSDYRSGERRETRSG